MNILPKKRWHVRTKDNIARVRRDEALAAEEEKKKQLRIQTAEREARAQELRKQARERYGSHGSSVSKVPEPSSKSQEESIFGSNKHVNLFYELENESIVSDKPNEEHEREKKLEKEKYEKQIGYLVYLGQDTNELTGNVSWYNKLDKKNENDKTEVSQKQKIFEDPLSGIRKYLGCESIKKIKDTAIKVESETSQRQKQTSSESSDDQKLKKKMKKAKHRHVKKKKKKEKYKKHKSSSSELSVKNKPQKCNIDIEKLRNERLKRELQERQRANELFARINGVNIKKEESTSPKPVQKYNSQFNPHLAKQNF